MADFYDGRRAAAGAIGASENTIQKWVRDGRLHPTRIRRQGGGRPIMRFFRDDLLKAARGTQFEEQPTQMGLVANNGGAKASDPLSLHVLWEEQGRVEPFSLDLMRGYSTFRAATYTPSVPAIVKLLELADWERFDVLFGSERLARASSAADVVMLQGVIQNEKASQFVGARFADEKQATLADAVAAGKVRLSIMSGGISHLKIYLLEGKRGRRAMAGSANLSLTALTGRQAETLFAWDDNEFIWDALTAILDGLEAREPIPMDIGELTGEKTLPARVIDAADLPAVRLAENEKRPVDIYTAPPDEFEGGVTGLVVNNQFTGRATMPAKSHITGGGGDVVRLELAVVKAIKRETVVHAADGESGFQWLTRTDSGVFVYNDRPVKRPVEMDGVARDAFVIRQYFRGFDEFPSGASIIKRVYFAFMGWLYFSPFMAGMKRRLQRLGGGEFTRAQMVAVLYGSSNCGKTSLVKFLMSSMMGEQKEQSDKQFTSRNFLKDVNEPGLYPLFYDDVEEGRFVGGGAQAAKIVKEYDKLVKEMAWCPTSVVSANAEARHFGDAFRKRSAFFFISNSIPISDTETNDRTASMMADIRNQIGQDFYAEYLHRMAYTVDHLTDSEMERFDYMRESTSLIRDLLLESQTGEERLPEWAIGPVDKNSIFEISQDVVRRTLANLLSREYMADEDPPPPNTWIERREKGQILAGVEDAREALQQNVFPEEITLREFSQGGVVTLDSERLQAFMERSSEFADWEIPRRGIGASLKRLIQR